MRHWRLLLACTLLKTNMNPENGPWKSVFLYQPLVFRVHVSLPGCILTSLYETISNPPWLLSKAPHALCPLVHLSWRHFRWDVATQLSTWRCACCSTSPCRLRTDLSNISLHFKSVCIEPQMACWIRKQCCYSVSFNHQQAAPECKKLEFQQTKACEQMWKKMKK